MIIAIDGPAGSGKSSTARRVASDLGFLYLDTGAMYRAVALAFLRDGIEFDESRAAEVLAGLILRVESGIQGQRVYLGEEDVSIPIREPDVSTAASLVSRLPSVRRFLVDEQRRIAAAEEAKGRGVVMEGRDIGTVVFPGAGLKIFLTADPEERARRRAAEYRSGGRPVDEAELQAEIVQRDRRDTERSESPLRAAPDAVVVDTTRLTLDMQVLEIVRIARERGA